MGNAFSGITPRIKRRIIQKGGTELNFHYGLGGFKNPDKLRDEHLVDFLNDDAAVSPDRVTRICLTLCTGITDKALIAIADTCHNLTWLSVTGCKNITGPGIDAIARKCRKLKTLWASDCNISYLPEDIGMLLPHLTFLHLFDNKIQKIPASLGRLADSLTLFYIDSNPLQQPPLEIVNQGLHAIQLYYDELDKGYKVSNIIQEVVLLG